ncbi:type IV secretory pathway, VirB4 component [Pseudomonas aeruginosa]|nr:type IV secretory pathway, VirB4 component [Pseudomonas aeruginosa]
MTENEEKNQRYNIMQATGCDELEAALQVAADLDKARGLPPSQLISQTKPAVECQDE